MHVLIHVWSYFITHYYKTLSTGKQHGYMIIMYNVFCPQANTSNVRIEEKGVLDAGMDNFELELLSTRRHFEELQEYQAPSLSQT